MLRPRDAGALYCGGGRAEDQADPAFGARADRSLGIQPDILLCRCEKPAAAENERAKIALFCNVRKEAVIPALDAQSRSIRCRCSITARASIRKCCAVRHPMPGARSDARWTDIVDPPAHPEGEVTIGVVGKYVGLQDAYKSLNEALVHGGMANRVKVNIQLDRCRDLRARGQPRSPRISSRCTASWCPAGSASAARSGKIQACAVCALSAGCRISASASACRWPASRARATLAGIAECVVTEFGPTKEPVVGIITEWMKGTAWKARAGRR